MLLKLEKSIKISFKWSIWIFHIVCVHSRQYLRLLIFIIYSGSWLLLIAHLTLAGKENANRLVVSIYSIIFVVAVFSMILVGLISNSIIGEVMADQSQATQPL